MFKIVHPIAELHTTNSLITRNQFTESIHRPLQHYFKNVFDRESVFRQSIPQHCKARHRHVFLPCILFPHSHPPLTKANAIRILRCKDRTHVQDLFHSITKLNIDNNNFKLNTFL